MTPPASRVKRSFTTIGRSAPVYYAHAYRHTRHGSYPYRRATLSVLGEGQGGGGQFRFYDLRRSLQANDGRQIVAPTFAVKLRFTRVAGGVDPYGMVCTGTVINMLISLNGREKYGRRGPWQSGPVFTDEIFLYRIMCLCLYEKCVCKGTGLYRFRRIFPISLNGIFLP